MASSPQDDAAIRATLLRHRKTKTICYMEAGKDFVDLLFSFLTLPTGTVLKLFEESGSLKPLGAAIANVFGSVKQLDSALFYVEKDILLKQEPVCSVLAKLPNTVLKIEATLAPGPAQSGFRCNCSKTFTLLEKSPVVCKSCGTNTQRACSIFLEAAPTKEPQKPGKVGFVKKNTSFLITDDLQITPASSISTIGLLSKLEVEATTDLETIVVAVGASEALQLLQSSFCKRAALNDVFGPKTKFAAQVA